MAADADSLRQAIMRASLPQLKCGQSVRKRADSCKNLEGPSPSRVTGKRRRCLGEIKEQDARLHRRGS